MITKVDKEKCIGCGSCVAICPEVYEIETDGKAGAKAGVDCEQYAGKVNEAKDACPAMAISVE
jgi:ferredoxin